MSSSAASVDDLVTCLDKANDDIAQLLKSPLPLRERAKLMAASRRLFDTAEGNAATIWKTILGLPAESIFLCALKMGVFKAFDEGQNEMSVEAIAAKTGSDKRLMSRIMKAISSLAFFDQVDTEVYAHNEYSRHFSHPIFITLLSGAEPTKVAILKLHEFLTQRSFQNPDDSEDTLFKFGLDTHLNLFDWLKEHPDELKKFSDTMATSAMMEEPTLLATLGTLFPEQLPSTDNVVIVDVGGGRGRILNAFRKARPDLKGKMIVQDLPQEIDERDKAGDEESAVEGMAYDFFTPQPVKGANVYFFRHILHDWSDTACCSILESTIPALGPKGRIVISDAVVSDAYPSVFATMLDIRMMALGGTERTEQQWKDLLGRCGLKVVRCEGREGGVGDRIIEAVLA